MWASTCWGLLGLAATAALSVLGLSREWIWLQPVLLSSATILFVASIACFCWPLRLRSNRKELAKTLSFWKPKTERLVAFPIAWKVPIIQSVTTTKDGNIYIRRLEMTGQNVSQKPLQLDNAYVRSGITGKCHEMKVVVPSGEPALPRETNHIPAGAKIHLVTDDFKGDQSRYPSWMPENDFMQEWGILQFVVQ